MSKERLDPRVFEVHADFCRVMSNATRLRIMWHLREGECSVTELAEALALPVPNVSQHLRIMRDKGAVVTRRESQTVHYRISNDKFVRGLALIREGINDELRRHVRDISP